MNNYKQKHIKAAFNVFGYSDEGYKNFDDVKNALTDMEFSQTEIENRISELMQDLSEAKELKAKCENMISLFENVLHQIKVEKYKDLNSDAIVY